MTDTLTTPELLDCGHAPVRPPGMSTFVGTTVRHVDGSTCCLRCAVAAELRDWYAHRGTDAPSVGVYLSNPDNGPRYLTTWTGAKLARVTSAWRTSSGFGGWRPDGGRMYFRATDEAGREWHGSTPGPGMYARARLCKGHA